MAKSIGLDQPRLREQTPEVGYPTHVYPYTAGIVGGALGGLAMVIPAIAYGLISGRGIWYPVNLVAATVIMEMQAMTPDQLTQFSLVGLTVGLAIHFALAMGLGLLFVMLLPTLAGRPIVWGLIVGSLLWFGASFVILPQINPVMSQLVDWPSFALANLFYGLVLGYWVSETPLVHSERAHHLHFHRPSFLRR